LACSVLAEDNGIVVAKGSLLRGLMVIWMLFQTPGWAMKLFWEKLTQSKKTVTRLAFE